jgi:Protein of unknown function (DUF1376)
MSGSELLPSPLVPFEVDLRGFPGFILDVDRMLSSEFVAVSTPEEFKAAVLLWGHAWKQRPVASLPDDDRILAVWSGAGRRWGRVKERALWGFVKCSDGRLYHRFLAEEAKISWQRREKYRNRSIKANEAKYRVKSAQPVDHIDSDSPSRTPTRMQEGALMACVEEKRSKEKKEVYMSEARASDLSNEGIPLDLPPIPKLDPEPSEGYTQEFLTFWAAYPRKDAKGAAYKAFEKAKKRAKVERIMSGVKAYAKRRKGEDPQYTKLPTTWLNGDCWNDEPNKEPPKMGGGYVPLGVGG